MTRLDEAGEFIDANIQDTYDPVESTPTVMDWMANFADKCVAQAVREFAEKTIERPVCAGVSLAPVEFQRANEWGCVACKGSHPIEVTTCPEATKWREGDTTLNGD